MMTLKNYFFCCCFMFLGCTGSSQSVKPKLKDSLQTADKEFTLYPGQGTTINGIEVYLLDINDSRCPADVDCSWRGTVTLTLKIKKDGKAFDHLLTINLNKTQYLTENYDIAFTGVKPERGRHSQKIPKSDYRATLLLKNTTPSFKVTEIKEPVGVIFPKNGPAYRPAFKEAQDYWSPSIEDAKKADNIMWKYISDPVIEDVLKTYPEKIHDQKMKHVSNRITNIKENYPQYRRQYFGYHGKENGHKLIFINFFMPGGDFFDRTWKKQYISIYDISVHAVGYSFFNVLVDLEEGKCLSFKVNGQ